MRLRQLARALLYLVSLWLADAFAPEQQSRLLIRSVRIGWNGSDRIGCERLLIWTNLFRFDRALVALFKQVDCK